jgi:GH15 family glucan-1,4-alpha-glucosidase
MESTAQGINDACLHAELGASAYEPRTIREKQVAVPVHRYDMGVVGNCSYLAYIDTLARVRWLCMPRFDSSFVFGSLLDPERGGEFSISSSATAPSTTQSYERNTNILCTEFHVPGGAFRVTDFAPRFLHFGRHLKPLMFIRKLEPLSGEPSVSVACLPRGDWGAMESQVVTGSNHIGFLSFPTQVRLTTDIPLSHILSRNPFVLNQVRYLVFTYGEPLEAPLASTVEDFLRETRNYWIQWVKAAAIPSGYQEDVIRSALVLKLHQYEDTGGIIASGTTSLPEHDGSGRNWDYRYCWIRDSYYTLTAFSRLGHFEELEKYFHFIQNIVLSEETEIQPVYGIGGEKDLRELELPLAGYRDNRPVRIGNSAYLQRQNDVYGQLLICLLPLYTDQRLGLYRSRGQHRLIGWLLDRIEKTMEEPDAGLWEYRGRLQHHCHTYLFHWAGCRAAFKIAKALDDQALMSRAHGLVAASGRKIEQCFSLRTRAYTEAVGVEHMDASSLLLITMRYLDPASSRAADHLAALETALRGPNGLFVRYAHEDDIGVPAASFLACSFWYAEALAAVGRVDDACRTLETARRSANHLGLLSEDTDSAFGQWGNFPQTYSHVGFINAAYSIAVKRDTPLFLE